MKSEESINKLLYIITGYTSDELEALSPYELRILEDRVRLERKRLGKGNPSYRSVTSSACTSELEKYAVSEYKQDDFSFEEAPTEEQIENEVQQDKPKQKSKGTR